MITLFIRCRAVIILISFNGLHKEMMTGTDDLNRCQMICNSLGFKYIILPTHCQFCLGRKSFQLKETL